MRCEVSGVSEKHLIPSAALSIVVSAATSNHCDQACKPRNASWRAAPNLIRRGRSLQCLNKLLRGGEPISWHLGQRLLNDSRDVLGNGGAYRAQRWNGIDRLAREDSPSGGTGERRRSCQH